MIIRIYEVTIKPELRKQFEHDFNTIAVDTVNHHKGLISCEIGYPTKWNPNDYTMITYWEDEHSLAEFAGENWNTAVIPTEMQKYPVKFSVVHYKVNK